MPVVVCVVGKKKSGKTTTVVGLVQELTRRGFGVMTIKHGHGFDLDTPGRDSWRHRHEGSALRTVAAGPEGFAVIGDWPGPEPLALSEIVSRFLDDAEVVVVEGYKASDYPRIEVYRRSAHEEPILGSELDPGAETLALLTDLPDFEAPVPVIDVDAPGRFARLVEVLEERFPELVR